jgi:hypothetical protein
MRGAQQFSVLRWCIRGAVLWAALSGFDGGFAVLAEETFEKTNSAWFEKVEPGGRVSVDNPYGNIYARFGGYENEVEILASIQRIDNGRPPLQVRRTVVEGGLTIVVEPAEADTPDTPDSLDERRDRIDLVIFVPQGLTLDARTQKDMIEAKGLKGDIKASSVQGDINIRSITGRVDAESSRGRIYAGLESNVTQEHQHFSTVTGEIEIHLWEDAVMQVDLATSGEISTDFTLRIEHRRFEEPGKFGYATLGEGGPRLTLQSKRGRIRLLRLQKDFKLPK